MSTDIETRITQIRQSMEQAERAHGREPGSTQLLAVSKTQPVEQIVEVLRCGIHHIGESYLNEAEDKIDKLRGQSPVWHFIGPIQSNKTRAIAEKFAWVHSVDRLKIAQRLSMQRPESCDPLNICLQVNISEESSKSGVTPDKLNELARQVAGLPNLKLRGLMTIPARTDNFDEQRRQFAQLRILLDQLKQWDDTLDTLSMGMSNDFEAAIAEGSTLIRIGTGIFGTRKT